MVNAWLTALEAAGVDDLFTRQTGSPGYALRWKSIDEAERDVKTL